MEGVSLLNRQVDAIRELRQRIADPHCLNRKELEIQLGWINRPQCHLPSIGDLLEQGIPIDEYDPADRDGYSERLLGIVSGSEE